LFQIRKALKRKHTLPNYKFRYKPFFTKSDPGEEEGEYAQRSVQQGILEVTVVEATRISGATGSVYCSLAVGKFVVVAGGTTTLTFHMDSFSNDSSIQK